MSDTLPSIKLDSETWVEIYAKSNIDRGTKIEIQNTGTTDLYYSVLEGQPSQDAINYKIFKRGETVFFNKNDLFVWIFSPQANGLINVGLFSSTTQDLLVVLIEEVRNLNSSSSESNELLLKQIKLLNARFEEMATTYINENDIS